VRVWALFSLIRQRRRGGSDPQNEVVEAEQEVSTAYSASRSNPCQISPGSWLPDYAWKSAGIPLNERRAPGSLARLETFKPGDGFAIAPRSIYARAFHQ